MSPQPHSPVPAPRASEPPAPTPRNVVVVAVDGSDASVRALVWAMRYAVEHGLRIEALTAWPLHGAVFVREVAGHFCEPRWRAREALADAVARALAAVPAAPGHDLRVVNAGLVDALVRAGNRAVMVVIGSDSPVVSKVGRLSEQVRRTVPAPVVVVGPDGPVDGDAETSLADLHSSR